MHAPESSLELASRIVVLAVTNIAAFAVTLYVFVRYPRRTYQSAAIAALSCAHVSHPVHRSCHPY